MIRLALIFTLLAGCSVVDNAFDKSQDFDCTSDKLMEIIAPTYGVDGVYGETALALRVWNGENDRWDDMDHPACMTVVDDFRFLPADNTSDLRELIRAGEWEDKIAEVRGRYGGFEKVVLAIVVKGGGANGGWHSASLGWGRVIVGEGFGRWNLHHEVLHEYEMADLPVTYVDLPDGGQRCAFMTQGPGCKHRAYTFSEQDRERLSR